MHHAAGIIERIHMHRQARVTGRAENAQQIAQRNIEIDGDNIGARHHHVIDAAAAQGQHVFEHFLFARREVIARTALGQGIGKIIADAGVVAKPDPAFQPVERAVLQRGGGGLFGVAVLCGRMCVVFIHGFVYYAPCRAC